MVMCKYNKFKKKTTIFKYNNKLHANKFIHLNIIICCFFLFIYVGELAEKKD